VLFEFVILFPLFCARLASSLEHTECGNPPVISGDGIHSLASPGDDCIDLPR